MAERDEERRRPKVLIAGRHEVGLAKLCEHLDKRGVDVCLVEGALGQATLNERPNLVLLVGDAASDDGASGIDEVRRVASTPVVVTTDPEPLDRRLSPFQYGAVGILVRRGDAEEMAGELSHLLAENARMAAQRERLGSGAFDALVGLGSAELRASPTPSEGNRRFVVPRPPAIIPEDPHDSPTRELALAGREKKPSLASPHETSTAVALALPDWDEDLKTKQTPQHELARWRRIAAQDRAILPTPREMPGATPPPAAKRTPRSQPGVAVAGVATVGGIDDPLPAVLSEPPPTSESEEAKEAAAHDPAKAPEDGTTTDAVDAVAEEHVDDASKEEGDAALTGARAPASDEDLVWDLPSSGETPASRETNAIDATSALDALAPDQPADAEIDTAPVATVEKVSDTRAASSESGAADRARAEDVAGDTAEHEKASAPPGHLSLSGLELPAEPNPGDDAAWGAGTLRQSRPPEAEQEGLLPVVGMTSAHMEERDPTGSSRRIKSLPPPAPPMPRKGISPFAPGTAEHDTASRPSSPGQKPSRKASGGRLGSLAPPSSPSLPAFVDRASTLRAEAVLRPRASVLPAALMLLVLMVGTGLVVSPFAMQWWQSSQLLTSTTMVPPLADPPVAVTQGDRAETDPAHAPILSPTPQGTPPPDAPPPDAPAAPGEATAPVEALEPSVGESNDDGNGAADTDDAPSDAAAQRRASDDLISEAEALTRSGDLDRAHAALERAVETDPVNPHALIALAEERLAAGDAAQAVRLAERAVQLRRRRAAYHIVLGDAHRLSGDRPRARRSWQAALELEPDSDEASRRLAAR